MLHTQEAASSLYILCHCQQTTPFSSWEGGVKNSRIAIRDTSQASRLSNPRRRAPREDIIPAHGEPVLVAVKVRHDGQLGVGKVALLDQHLRAHARVDARRGVALVARAVQVHRAKAHRGQPRVDVGEEVVVVRHVQLALILGRVVVRVPDQGALPLL